MKKKTLISVIIAIIVVFVFAIPKQQIKGDIFNRINEHELNKTFREVDPSVYVSYTEVRENLNNNSELQSLINNKVIMFNTAEELHYWSQDMSYASNTSNAVKTTLAQSDYTLGANIDYSTMKSRRFMPIGYNFDEQGVNKQLVFSGTFDGRGFEINELELEIYSNFYFEEEHNIIIYSTFFSMFTNNSGTIKDIGLINPIIELNNEHVSLRDFSYLVGKNTGTVENSYVIDTRNFGQAGMRISAMKTEAATQKRAAGLVHTNNGTLKNSFYSGVSVVSADFMHVILEEPIYYFNNDTTNNVIYNSTRYGFGVPNELYQAPVNGLAKIEADIINNNNNGLSSDWYYYKDEDGALRFPKRYGLLENNGAYEINDAVDFMTFIRLLTFKTEAYTEKTYYINNDINMQDISPEGYKMPEVEFNGIITADEQTQAQISNLVIKEGLNIDDGYHLGLFYSLGGTFENIKLYNLKIKPTTLEDFTGQTFYVGAVASKLMGGTIKNLSINGEIDFSYKYDSNQEFKIGAYSVGMIAGEAAGTIEKVYISDQSEIKFGNINYSSSNRLTPNFYLGGAVGKTTTTKLRMYNVLNEGVIENIDVNRLYINNDQEANFYIGGVIGSVNNTSLIEHNIGLISNSGTITTHSLMSSSSINTYLGGVIGLSSGNKYHNSSTYGMFSNDGSFVYENSNNKNLYVAGVLNSNHNVAVEFIQISNNNNLTVNEANVTVSSLINHLSNNKLTISQATSKGEIEYSTFFKEDVHGAIYTLNKNTEVQLNYVNVETDLFVYYQNIIRSLNIAGVTLNENTNYLNVTYGGHLKVDITINQTLTFDPEEEASVVVWIAGITKQLSSNKVMRNSMNEGIINAYVGTNNTNNNVIKNLYVGGLVNINQSGDLHTQTSSMPNATKGIINSINRADMTSYFDSHLGITGRINTFAGGIASINRGSIQDVVNDGSIRFSNTTDGTASQFVDISGDVDDAGKTKMYKTGVVIGGIVGVVTHGYSRIYDSINNGNILAQSYYYSRSGGILGVVSPFDVSAGKVYQYYNENNDATDITHLKHSVISNGINYGNIYAITSVIGVYDTANLTRSNGRAVTNENLYLNTNSNYYWPTQQAPSLSMASRQGSAERIALHSAAGGIIGSGLSVLKRMINHGQIGATDAAGGIIGSIFVFVNKGWKGDGRNDDVGVTIINVNTAINYGDVRAVRRHSSGSNNNYFNQIYNKADDKISEINNIFYSYNDDFITPTNPRNGLNIRLFPEHKRGIGGIIGRIQRGGNQNILTKYQGMGFSVPTGGSGADLSNEEGSFDFIVNMNPNVDLIGRLDQNYNFSLSGTAFHFYDAIYYSAKPNDNTQAVFTGFLVNMNLSGYFVQGANANVTESTSGWIFPSYTYNVTGAVITYQNASYQNTQLQKGQVLQDDSTPNLSYSQVYSNNSSFSISAGRTRYDIYDMPGGKFISTSSSATFGNAKPVPFITETQSNNSDEYVYHEDFVMRDDNTTLTTGESITDYIYYADKDLLSDRFQISRPNGMYVLSTTAGSTFGSVLPRNFNINKLTKLLKNVPNNIDYNNVDDNYLDFEETSFIDILNIYKNQLYQTKLNDKSALLEQNQYLTVKDPNLGILVNDGTSDIDHVGKNVGIVIDRVVLGNIRELDFQIMQALIPENALIARAKLPSETVEQFQDKLKTFKEQNPNAIVATGDLAPTLYIEGEPANDVNYGIGSFVSYSEAAVMDSNFTNNSSYYTEYNLYIRITGSSETTPPYLYQISRDEGSFNTSFNNVTIKDYVTMRFRDQYGVLANGHVVDEYISLHYKDSNNNLHEVDKMYYQIDSVPKTSNQYFNTKITLDNELRNGTYVIKYKIYAQQTEATQEIIYDHNRVHEIYEFKPYTNKVYDNTTADYSFGYNLDFTTPFTESTYENKVYLARYNYQVPFLESFSASSFFEIDEIDVTDVTGESNYKRYRIRFNLKDGTYIDKFIEESELAPIYYKNNVKVTSSISPDYEPNYTSNFVTREAERTTFSLIYNMVSSLYNTNDFYITIDGNTVLTNSQGVYYNTENNRLNIVFDESLAPGEYEVKVYYVGNNKNIPAGNLLIEKLQGTSAYLNNIKFSEFVPGIEYPDIYAVNNTNSSINTTYELGIYYRGIDYHTSEMNKHQYYRIDGQVSGIPLNDYMPLSITDYLPLGAKIQRKYYVNEVEAWSDLVDNESTEEEVKESLATDFTVDPVTGDLQFDEISGEPILPYIEYRVVSEDGENNVTYFISVRDITYSFLAVFNYVYFNGTNYYPIDEVAKFNNHLLVLNIYNYEVKNEGTLLKDDYVLQENEAPPSFDEIVKIKSTMTQFYKVVFNVTNNQYIYSLGNNFSGFYHFFLDIDKKYYIREGTTAGTDLVDMSENISDLEGYYYYINASPITRTRYFTVIITDEDLPDNSWGLTNIN